MGGPDQPVQLLLELSGGAEPGVQFGPVVLEQPSPLGRDGGQVVADAGQGQAESAQAGDGQRPLELLGTVGPVAGGRVDAAGSLVLLRAPGLDHHDDGRPLHTVDGPDHGQRISVSYRMDTSPQ